MLEYDTINVQDYNGSINLTAFEKPNLPNIIDSVLQQNTDAIEGICNKPFPTSAEEQTEVEGGRTIIHPIPSSDLEIGDKFFGTISTAINKRKMKITSNFQLIDKNPSSLTVKDLDDENHPEYKTSRKGTTVKSSESEDAKKAKTAKEKEKLSKLEKQEKEIKKQLKEQALKETVQMGVDAVNFTDLEPEDKLRKTIDAGIENIWMVGPAGCGKSTMARNVAKEKELPYLCISCGIGTSAAEFIGYKYPTREATKFAEYYAKPSIILVDEFTALDPSVAQVVNAALANGEIETTTGTVVRHPECIIIATSNTFGSGADRQYVANNQLDASTIDRFIGGIIEVNYSESFESQYDTEVVMYVNELRKIIKDNNIRRVASTRMIQAGHNLKRCHFIDWKDRLIVSWTDNEKMIVKNNMADFTEKYIAKRTEELYKEFLEFQQNKNLLKKAS